MRHSALFLSAAMFVALAGAASAGTSDTVQLAPVDYAFIAQTNLGNQFQIGNGKLGETHARSAAVRDYATLMDSSHVQVENNLMVLLQRMSLEPPPWQLRGGLRLKDVQYGLQLAQTLGIGSPFSLLAGAKFRQLCDLGFEGDNESTIIEISRREAPSRSRRRR
jgi:hypothetical protein